MLIANCASICIYTRIKNIYNTMRESHSVPRLFQRSSDTPPKKALVIKISKLFVQTPFQLPSSCL